MEIDNEAFFEVHTIGDPFPQRIPIYGYSRVCAYCGTNQNKEICTNCGAPYEGVLLKKPTPPPSRIEDEGGWAIYFLAFIIAITGAICLTILFGGGL